MSVDALPPRDAVMTVIAYGLVALALIGAVYAAWGLYREQRADVTTDRRFPHQTWNTCPECRRSWPDDVPTPGLLHRTRRCPACPVTPSITRRRLQLVGRHYHPTTPTHERLN